MAEVSPNPESPLFGSLEGGIPGRYAHSCVFFQGKIYLYGGRNDVAFFEKVECFDPGMCVCYVLYATLKNCLFSSFMHDFLCDYNSPVTHSSVISVSLNQSSSRLATALISESKKKNSSSSGSIIMIPFVNDNLLFFFIAISQWSVIEAVNEYGQAATDEDIPNGRYAHACSLDGHVMYIQVSNCCERVLVVIWQQLLIKTNKIKVLC